MLAYKYALIKTISIYIIFVLISLLGQNASYAQKVGVVLSGGGAGGIAHIGVLKALEENNIPIDYITGTSMGALVGCMYAIGYSPKQIEEMVTSEGFRNVAYGIIDDKYIYYFKQKEPNGSWITIKFAPDFIIQTTLPTNFISPIPVDLSLMENLSGPSAVADYNFNNLFIPFRCVASDVAGKKQVIFKSGHLNEAVRASMSYPFYLKPITVDGKLLFDGGLYNNFPADVMYNDFYPDIIIGSNVTANVPPPEEDNLVSQVKSMLVNITNYSTICDNGILIEPEISIALFDFDDPVPIIDKGYEATMLKINEIKSNISRKADKEELEKKRKVFRDKIPELKFNTIHIEGLNRTQSSYVKKLLSQKEKEISFIKLKPAYYRLISDDKIKNIFPIAKYDSKTGKYDLYLKIKKEREIITHFGGNLSNKPINQGFVGIQYNYLGNSAITLTANTYFGKLYGSGQLKAKIDFPNKLPFYIDGGITLNRWDFFKSSNAFFEDVKPSYLVQNEKYGEANIGMPISNKGKLEAGASYVNLRNEYYQVRDFSVADTLDRTNFNLITGNINYERSSLNRKQYASEGAYFALKARYIQGEEFTKPGSTSITELPFRGIHEWMQFKLVYDNYYKRKGNLKLGFYMESVYSTQPFFHNYTGTILAAPAFMPTPETQTIFLEKFRAYKYGAFGLKNIINFKKNIDLRIEGYVFQSLREIVKQDDLTPAYGAELSKRYYLATTALVYHSPIGPLSLSVNYYDKEEEPFSFLFHFGYILFNKRALD